MGEQWRAVGGCGGEGELGKMQEKVKNKKKI
jgi:hypothetical protein